MRRSKFKRPKMVLIFNGAQTLIAVTRSLNSAAELTKGNVQAISFCCTGRYISSGSLYFRHLLDSIEIEITDIGTLQLPEYDDLCGVQREYYTVRQMAHRRENKKAKKLIKELNDNEHKMQ